MKKIVGDDGNLALARRSSRATQGSAKGPLEGPQKATAPKTLVEALESLEKGHWPATRCEKEPQERGPCDVAVGPFHGSGRFLLPRSWGSSRALSRGTWWPASGPFQGFPVPPETFLGGQWPFGEIFNSFCVPHLDNATSLQPFQTSPFSSLLHSKPSQIVPLSAFLALFRNKRSF